jgi:hypothetical protein
VALLALAVPAEAVAGEEFSGLGDLTIGAYILEFIVPDVRVELGNGRPGIVLTAPIVLGLLHQKEARPLERSGYWLTVLLEPQMRVNSNVAWRGLAGVRFYAPAISGQWGSAFVEAAGVVGQDGSGVAGGVGVSILRYVYPFLSVGYRLVWAGDHIRHDVTIDLSTMVIPLMGIGS